MGGDTKEKRHERKRGSERKGEKERQDKLIVSVWLVMYKGRREEGWLVAVLESLNQSGYKVTVPTPRR